MFSSNPPRQRLEPGTIIEGRYRVSQLVASNGGSAVYTATHLMMGRNVTLQLLNREGDKTIKRFRRAARLVSMMRHPNVVTVHDMGMHGPLPYLVLEYLDGQSLAERSALRGPLRIDEFAPVAEQVLSALGYVHSRNLIHRDISAQNLVFTKSQYGEVVKLSQFAFSKEVGGTNYTTATEQQRLVQSLTHVAPEQILNPEGIDHRVDLYAVGTVFYQLLTGMPPVQARSLADLGSEILEREPPPLRQYVDHVSPSLEEAVMRALAKNPADRYPSAEEMWKSLEQSLFSSLG